LNGSFVSRRHTPGIQAEPNTIMISVFRRRTTVRLVRFYASSSAQAVAGLLKSLQRNSHGFAFDAADVTATPIFSDN
jgi:hypothetical protein